MNFQVYYQDKSGRWLYNRQYTQSEYDRGDVERAIEFYTKKLSVPVKVISWEKLNESGFPIIVKEEVQLP